MPGFEHNFGFGHHKKAPDRLGGPFISPSTVFSPTLWTGTGAAQNVVNGIDMTKGGMILTKERSTTDLWKFFDTARGVNTYLPISTGSAQAFANSVTAYNNNGFSLGNAASGINTSGNNYVGWTFRKSARFFDVITYTGDGTALRAIPHSLGITPGLVITKRRDSAGSPAVSHVQSNPGHQYNLLNDNALPTVNDTTYGGQAADASNVYVGNSSIMNASGGTYVMWVFAHDPSSDGIIQCGKYTGNGLTAGPVITLPWKPQFVMVRRISGGTGNWAILDTARGLNDAASGDLALNPNLAQAETAGDFMSLQNTGFTITTTSTSFNAAASDYVYAAIRS